MLTIISKSFDIFETVDTLYKNFILKNPSTEKIKIEIKFFDERGNLIKPVFFFKTKILNPKNKLHNYLKSSYINFINKNVKQKVFKYEINIIKI